MAHGRNHKRSVDHTFFYVEQGFLELEQKSQAWLLWSGHAAWIPEGTSIALGKQGQILELAFTPELRESTFYQTICIFTLPDVGIEMARHLYHGCMKNDSTEAILKNAFYAMLPDWSAHTPDIQLPATGHPKLSVITAFIREHGEDPLTTRKLCRRFGLSERSLCRLFHNELGLTFRTYLRMVRISRAMDLLSLRQWSVTDTAFEVGYNSLCAFSDAFRKLVGVRPREYVRLNAREKHNHHGH